VSTPGTPTVDLSTKSGGACDASFNYRSVMGILLYLAVKTRPDIAVVVSMLCSHVEEPSKLQEAGAKRILRYLNSTADAALHFQPGLSDQLSSHIESSWGGERGFGRRSRTGIVIKYGNATIYTTSILQKCTALSSTEAEFIALNEGSRTITWIRRVLEEFGINQKPTIVYQDNAGSIVWATGNVASQFAKRKHVDIRYHFVIEKIREGAIELRKIDAVHIESDYLTKILGCHEFIKAIKKANILYTVAITPREEE